MKSALPFRGVAVPEVRRLVRTLTSADPPVDRALWQRTITELWDEATHREERYAALALSRHRAAREWQDVAAVELYRHLIVTGAWWDLVDELATWLIGPILAGHRADMTRVIQAWALDEDRWLRRTAILCQLKHRTQTDPVWVRDILDRYHEDLSALSSREAMKHLA